MTIHVFRKRLAATPLVENILHFHAGGLNLEACRVPFVSVEDERESKNKNQHGDYGTAPLTGNIIYGDYSMMVPTNYNPPGRWPANLVIGHFASLDEYRFFKHVEGKVKLTEYLKALITPGPEQGVDGVFVEADGNYDWSRHTDGSVHGILLSDDSGHSIEQALRVLTPGGHLLLMSEGTGHAGACYAEDIGFEVRDCILVADSPTDKLHYVPKASKKEREQGLEDFEPTVVTSSDSQEDETEGDEKNSAKKRKNTHPTVKAVKVMERLLMDIPEGSIVLDPFAGSGTTGVAASGKFNFVGIEKEQEYFDIAKARIAASAQKDDKNEGNST